MASRRLGAVFHFTRDEQARNKGSILALARQLARWADQRLRSSIASAIESARKEGLDIAQMTPENQFQQLIEEPMRSLDGASPALVVILDALDECEEAYAKTLLRLFGGLFDKLPNNVKLFITSRGELQLQQCYNSEPLKSQLETHFLADEKIEQMEEDISVYFKQELPALVGHLVTNPLDWPGKEKRRALVSKTQGLFICATTVARMLADPNMLDPETQLEGILSSNDAIRLDDVYGQILDRACPTSSHNNLLALFRNVLGAPAVVRVPINIHTLASLLSPDGVEDPREGTDEQRSEHERFANRIRVSVLCMQAVLIVPDVGTPQAQDANPIRFIHSSFIDYLTDESRCKPRFLLDLSRQHEQLAIGCLRRMRNLERNMRNLDPSLLNSEVEDLEERIRENISPGLQYACAHMPEHVSQTPAESAEVESLVREFARVRLMNWLEGLSLMGRVHEAVRMALLIESWLKASLHLLASPSSSNTVPFVHTADDHCSSTTGPIPGSPAIPQSVDLGKRAKIGRFFHKLGTLAHVPSSTIMASTVARVPSQAALTVASLPATTTPQIGGVDDGIFHDLQRFILTFMEPIVMSSLHIYSSALVLMPSKTGLSCHYGQSSEDGLKVVRGRAEDWSQTLWTATKHCEVVSCVAASPDGTTIVSGSHDSTLQLWDSKIGAAIGKAMEGHTSSINYIAVSPDGTNIISGSHDNTLTVGFQDWGSHWEGYGGSHQPSQLYCSVS
ncbi:hypothetical protein FRB94_000391 [Tulasnella sp. JGI-2019a]|nr:hypothetical protein FRB93_011884 [Tulasnella sp. JGI-2019a]KAG8988789.1 hypothetical protein FRB94_000391 [Tulasnella sp. JGI-2019a]KAG9022459.1 hypothetical protein FRB95_014773 [Tulasnella sp. JGI-2019a]